MRRRIVISSIVVLVVLIGGYAWVSERTPGPPPRPAGVPSDAVWVGVNKGDWIDCKPLQAAATFRCDVFADLSGDRLSTGDYVLEKSTTIEAGKGRPIAYDGQVIETDVGRLVPYGVHTYFGGGRDSWSKDLGPRPTAK